MPVAGLLFALVVPLLLGIAMLAACVRDGERVRAPGLVPWILGAGFVVGAFALSLVMRGVALSGVRFGIASVGIPSLAIAAGLAWLAWSRHGGAWRDALRDARATLFAAGFDRGTRVLWFALLAWIAVRAGLLLAEVWTRPLYPWDAWSAWASKAKTYFAMGGIVPFVDAAAWASSATPVWYDASSAQPATIPLMQTWIATAMGAWDDARVGLPWWLWFVAILLVVYGELRQRGAAPTHALAAAWLAGSMPLLGTQVALAGYADLPMTAAFTLGTLAAVRAAGTRAPVDVVAAIAALAAVAAAKTAGWAWVAVALPGIAGALAPAWTRRIAIAVAAVAVGIVGVAARFPKTAIGPFSLAYDPVWDQLATEGVLLANWHLLALGVAGTAALAWRRLLAPGIAPLSLVLAAGAGWIAVLAAFPSFRWWGADGLGLNRAVLVLAPLAVVWMAVALREPPPRAAIASTGDAAAPA